MKTKVTCITKIVLIIIGVAVLTSYSGQWDIYTDKNDVRDIALAGNTLWAATTGGVVVWNLGDNSYKSFTTLDGLLSCNISQVAIDKKGRPWVVTKEPVGIFIYENHAWKQIDVGGAENEITVKGISDLEVDQFGNIWVCTRYLLQGYTRNFDNLWRYDGRTWHKHEGVKGPLALDPQKNLLAVDTVFYNESIHRDQFSIASFNGSKFVSKWRSKAHTHIWWFFLADIAQDSKGNLWISYYDDRYDDTYGVVCNNTVYNTLDGLAHDNVRGITAGESGTVWCATDGGISKFTGSSWVTYDTTKGVASNLVYKILIGSDNTLYAATSRGISILKSNQWRTLKTINEPSHNNYTDMVIDKRDAIIFAGMDHITIYNDLQWKTKHFLNIRFSIVGNYAVWNYSNKKSFIKSKDGALYAIGNEIGEYAIGNKNEKGWILKQGTGGSTFFKALSYTREKSNQFLLPAVTSSSNDSCFWLTDHYGNLIFLNKQTAEIFPPSIFGIYGNRPKITCMLLDRDGISVWVGYEVNNDYVGGFGMIVHFDSNTSKPRFTKYDSLSKRLTSIARDSSGNLWFASLKNRYQSGEVTVLRNSKFTRYIKDSDGNTFGSCSAVFVDKSGIVWTHTYNGIARFNGRSWKLFDRTAVSPDLPYANYSYMIQDKSGTMWFGTPGSGLLAYKNNRWYQFTTRNGIPCNSIRSLSLDSKDNLWILTDNGIAMRKSDGVVHNRIRHDFVNIRNKPIIKQSGNRFYVTSKDKPKMIQYTLFDLRGRVVHRQTLHNRKSFIIPESNFNYRFGQGLRILSITTKGNSGFQSKYFLKISDIK